MAEPSASSTKRRAVVTPGNHDGVHLGHRALLSAARTVADRDGLSALALTFDPHPAVVLAPERAPTLLTTLARRRELLLALGADAVHVQRFDREFASLSPEEFVRRVLVDSLSAAGVVVGSDFRFGRGRAGDLARLRELGRENAIAVVTVDPVTADGEVVSSTRIRNALGEGDVGLAARLLGRIHDVDASVVRGEQRGRTLGFPTANLACDAVLLPKDGVYAVVARRAGAKNLVHGVANLGSRPTFASGRAVEVHLFDFDADLYDARLRVGFVARIRAEQKFDGVDALKAQIGRDTERARVLLTGADQELWRWM
jgi:riboflavin kinase / FMN adenylyltransferase